MLTIAPNLAESGEVRVSFGDGFIQSVERIGEEHPKLPYYSAGFVDLQNKSRGGAVSQDDAELACRSIGGWCVGTDWLPIDQTVVRGEVVYRTRNS